METSTLITAITAATGVATLVNLVIYNYFFLPKINKSLEDYKSLIKLQDKVNEEKWLLKRDACMTALAIADSQISNRTYPNVKEGSIDKAPLNTTADVRTCINKLNCSCENPEVLRLLKVILFDSYSPDIIVDLRNAVREELNFGDAPFDLDRERAFVGRIG
jgi:hypothetical protein